MLFRVASFAVSIGFALVCGLASGFVSSVPIDARPAPRLDGAGLDMPAGRAPAAKHITGLARIVDGDTIEVAGQRIRLEGIDAPETAQTCARSDGGTAGPGAATWQCGAEATRFLAELTRNKELDCVSRGRDLYDRVLATCFLGNLDVNAEMVRRGLAWAFVKYSNAYVREEAAARASNLGIWQGLAQTAWDFRAKRWATASETAPEGCAIKGNVSGGGRIYHTPWSPWYGKVVMRAEKGTRWFCSEADAIAAGWRPAYTR